VPLENLLVLSLDWRGCKHAEEKLAVAVLLVVEVSEDVDLEMHTDAADNWPEGLLELPVDTIVEHVEKDGGLVADGSLDVA